MPRSTAGVYRQARAGSPKPRQGRLGWACDRLTPRRLPCDDHRPAKGCNLNLRALFYHIDALWVDPEVQSLAEGEFPVPRARMA